MSNLALTSSIITELKKRVC